MYRAESTFTGLMRPTFPLQRLFYAFLHKHKNANKRKRDFFSLRCFLNISNVSMFLIFWKRVCPGIRTLVQWRKKCIADSISLIHSHKGFKVSRKQCLNLCWWRWLRPRRNLVKSLFQGDYEYRKYYRHKVVWSLEAPL